MATSTGRSVTRSKESGQQRTNGRSVTTASFAPARRNADFRSTPGDSGRLSRAWNCVIFIVVLLCCFHSSQLSQPGTAGPVKFEGGTNEGAVFRRQHRLGYVGKCFPQDQMPRQHSRQQSAEDTVRGGRVRDAG